MKKGNEYELYIEKTEFPGQGIANFGDKKVYVKNALPGQKVKARITKKKKDYAEGKVTEVIEDVPYKIEPACPHFGECGGCSHQGVPYEKQLEFKKDQVLTLLDEAGVNNFEFLGIESSPNVFEYRNKMEFSFGDYDRGGELALGMHNTAKRFSIKTTEECQIVDSDYRLVLRTVLSYFNGKSLSHYRILNHEGFLRNLVIRKASNTGEILINIVTTSQMEFDFTELKGILLELPYEGKLKGIIHTINDSLADVVQADRIEVLFGDDYITENILGLKFKISPFSFFQTNSKGAEKLYSIVRDFMGDSSSKTVFDLYCGTGTIGQIAASSAKKVIGVELIEEAVEAANENARLNGLDNCTFIAGDVAKVIKDVKERPDIIILDPPRAGVHPTALDYVIKFDAKDIIYVSCNPKSLAVDLKVLTSNGYKVEKVKLMDMFPHTPHIESIVKIVK